MVSVSAPYRLDELGWLQFERLCGLVLEHEAGLAQLTWRGRGDRGRVALVDSDVVLGSGLGQLAGPAAVAVLWVREAPSAPDRVEHLLAGALAVPSELGGWFERVLVLTNLDGESARRELAQRFGGVRQFVVLGTRELGEVLDRRPEVRAAMPSVLGVRELEPLMASEVRQRATLDIDAAHQLARVFWPTRAYARARAVLGRHRFVVLTGPPEMGKTAIARMLGLVALADGWEAHECTSPAQVWTLFDRGRRQVFVADDAFGSTEYRADAAELWARELGRMLLALDDRHWLIWTSRPAPLKAGLRRVQRERGAGRFPAPGEVLVDASELDLVEKTLILFRHAKQRDAGKDACRELCSAAVAIVEHPHFTPERIRRFVAERLVELPAAASNGHRRLLSIVEEELARPTEAMRTSFRTLGDEHRELLVALLDAPAGLIGERDLAAVVRRHHSGGLSRPPGELIDRLSDHFLRITPLGVGWVHPSWRDLVVEELARHPGPRQRFLAACGVDGVLLALSRQGGSAGERALPLMVGDSDWDTLGDRLAHLLGELEDHDLARVLLGLREALSGELEPARHAEAASLAEYALRATCRAWRTQRRSLPVFLIEAWYAAATPLPEPVEPPPLTRTWTELHPSRGLMVDAVTVGNLHELDDWLTLAQVLSDHDRSALERLGFYDRDQQLLAHLAIELGEIRDPELRGLAENMLRRIQQLAPGYGDLAQTTLARLATPAAERWWVPRDIDTPPSSEPVTHERVDFTREDVRRVLADL